VKEVGVDWGVGREGWLALRRFGFLVSLFGLGFIVGGLRSVWGVCYKGVFLGLFSWFCFVWRALWFGNVVVQKKMLKSFNHNILCGFRRGQAGHGSMVTKRMKNRSNKLPELCF